MPRGCQLPVSSKPQVNPVLQLQYRIFEQTKEHFADELAKKLLELGATEVVCLFVWVETMVIG